MIIALRKIATVGLLMLSTAGLVSLAVSPAEAGRFRRLLPPVQQEVLPPAAVDFAQNLDDGTDSYATDGPADPELTIRPRESARIARQTVPGAKVLNVRLLPSGIYAVTLRGDGKLTRVMVDGRSGDIL